MNIIPYVIVSNEDGTQRRQDAKALRLLCAFASLRAFFSVHSYRMLHFYRTLTLSKAFNALKVYLSFHLSRLLQKPVLWGYPVALSVEPTTSCNLRCPECPSGLRAFHRPTGMLDKEFFKKVL